MTDWQGDYRKAQELALKYETAKKYGSTVPGNRKRENQTILVPRGEAVNLARDYKLRVHISRLYLEQVLAWQAYVRDVAKLAPGHSTCEKCGHIYIPLPENVECPFCRIDRDAQATVNAVLTAAVNQNSDE